MSDDVVARSDHLDATMTRFVVKTRLYVRILALSLLFDLVITFGLAYDLRQSDRATQRSVHAINGTRITCQVSNQTNANQLALWLYILSAQPSTPRTPEQQALAIEFQKHINTVFAQVKCP